MLGCAKKFKNRKNKIENPLRAAPEKPPRAPAAPCTTAGSLGQIACSGNDLVLARIWATVSGHMILSPVSDGVATASVAILAQLDAARSPVRPS